MENKDLDKQKSEFIKWATDHYQYLSAKIDHRRGIYYQSDSVGYNCFKSK